MWALAPTNIYKPFTYEIILSILAPLLLFGMVFVIICINMKRKERK